LTRALAGVPEIVRWLSVNFKENRKYLYRKIVRSCLPGIRLSGHPRHHSFMPTVMTSLFTIWHHPLGFETRKPVSQLGRKMGLEQKKPGGVRGPARPRRKKANSRALYKIHRGNGSKRTKSKSIF
jgi:hypothetical protein